MGDEGQSNDLTPLKRGRTGDLKRVAEIVMVLSAMGEMRAGKDPTAVEKALAVEARERLAGICETELKPKDLISREAVRVLVEDLGLNRSRDPMMGFRPSKLSISEKLMLTKRKMEESKSFAPHSSVYSSQHAPIESHGTSMRQNPMVFSTGGFHSVSLGGVHVPTVTSITPSLKQSRANEAQLATTPPKSSPLLAQHLNGAPANHEEICKGVQKILQPKVFDHPNWNPPSADYTNKPLNCQICKVPITDVESLLVCDACEKGTHLKCLQSFGHKEGAPKADWHCPRCLLTSHGKPFPPKYGRVTRTIPPQKTPSNTSASSDKRPVANGDAGLPVHASSSFTNCSESSPPCAVTSTNNSGELSGVVCALPCAKSESSDKEVKRSRPTNWSTEQVGVVCAPLSAEAEISDNDVKSCELPTSNMDRSTFVPVVDQKVESEQLCSEKDPVSVEVSTNQ